jgi:hypothetical protein
MLGVPVQSTFQSAMAWQDTKLGGTDTRPARSDEEEVARPRAEAAHLKMKHDILKRATA